MRKVGLFGISVLTLGFLSACDDGGVVSVNSAGNSSHVTVNDSLVFQGGEKGNLQGTIYDGITGERLGDSLEMYLIVGKDHRKPDVLVKTDGSVLEGEYAFENIPITDIDLLSNTVKLIVKRDGYHEFVSEFSYVSDDQDYNDYLSRIGNVYLYPESKKAQDLDVITLCGDLPCEGATVYLEQLTSLDDGATVTSTVSSPTNDVSLGGGRDTRLYPTLGLYPEIMATANSNGIAKFSADEILLGARYQVRVLPHTNSDDLRYVQYISASFVAGVDAASSQQSVTMVPAYTSAPAVGLASSAELNNGKLEIVLDRPISLVDTNVTATITSDSPNAITVQDVKVSLSSDGLTITLTPKFNRTLENAETLTITYANANTNPISYLVIGYEEGNDPVELFDLAFLKNFSFQKP